MIAKDLIPGMGTRSFVIMKYLVRHRSRKSHPPPRTHSPRLSDAFTAGHAIGWIYLPYRGRVNPRGNPVLLRQRRKMRAVATEPCRLLMGASHPPLCHIDVVPRPARTAPARTARTMGTPGTDSPRTGAHPKSRTHVMVYRLGSAGIG